MLGRVFRGGEPGVAQLLKGARRTDCAATVRPTHADGRFGDRCGLARHKNKKKNPGGGHGRGAQDSIGRTAVLRQPRITVVQQFRRDFPWRATGAGVIDISFGGAGLTMEETMNRFGLFGTEVIPRIGRIGTHTCEREGKNVAAARN